jgi:hypothetical protein
MQHADAVAELGASIEVSSPSKLAMYMYLLLHHSGNPGVHGVTERGAGEPRLLPGDGHGDGAVRRRPRAGIYTSEMHIPQRLTCVRTLGHILSIGRISIDLCTATTQRSVKERMAKNEHISKHLVRPPYTIRDLTPGLPLYLRGQQTVSEGWERHTLTRR